MPWVNLSEDWLYMYNFFFYNMTNFYHQMIGAVTTKSECMYVNICLFRLFLLNGNIIVLGDQNYFKGVVCSGTPLYEPEQRAPTKQLYKSPEWLTSKGMFILGLKYAPSAWIL